MKNSLLWSFTLMNTVLLLVMLGYIVLFMIFPQVGNQVTLKNWVIKQNQDTLNKVDVMNKNSVDYMNDAIPKFVDEQIEKKLPQPE